MRLDSVGFAQMVLFGFPLGERTLIEGRCFSEILPEHLTFTKSISENETLTRTPDLAFLFKNSVAKSLKKSDKPGILLSAGYDSRLVLSVLLALGEKPTVVTYHNRSTASEHAIASKIAKKCDLQFRPCEDRSIPDEELANNLKSYLANSKFMSNPVRLMYFNQVSTLELDMDCIFSGEGETFRFPGYPSEYLSEAAFSLLKNTNTELDPSGYIFNDLPFEEALYEAQDIIENWGSDLTLMEKIHRWLALEAYPKIYGAMAMAFGSIAPVFLPFLHPDLITGIYHSEYGMNRARGIQPSVTGLWNSRKAYYDVIGDLTPCLLSLPTDRGYRPAHDGSLFSFIPAYLLNKIKSRIILSRKPFRASEGARSYTRFLASTLSGSEIKSPIDRRQLVELLECKPYWNGETIHKLSQVLIYLEMQKAGLTL